MSDPHLPNPEPPDIEPLLARIAAMEPSADATRRALERARAALPADRPRGIAGRLMPRWPLAAAIAATMLIAFSLALILFPHRLTPRELLARTLQSTQDYKGWIHLTVAGIPNEISYDWNSQTQTSIARLARNSGEKPSHEIYMVDPPAKTAYDYSSQTNTIQINSYRPDRRMEITPSYFTMILAQMRDTLEKGAGQIDQSVDRGMNRIDLPSSAPAAESQPSEGMGRPMALTSVWVDQQTSLLRTALIDGHEVSITYGGQEYHTIYDAGAPQDAKVVDNRPDEPVRDVIDRLQQRIRKPLPDGVSAILNTSGSVTSLQVNSRKGKNWTHREYEVMENPVPGGPRLQLPLHWQDADTEEFFRRLGEAVPRYEMGGDGTRAWEGQFDPVTRQQFMTIGEEIVETNGRRIFSEKRLEGRQVYADGRVQAMEQEYDPARYLCPQDFAEASYPGAHADLVTSPDRPGQLCLHVTYTENGVPKNGVPGTLRMITQDWFDTAHDDRPVSFQRLTFVGDSRQVEAHEVTDFSGYQNLPAPDGRSYPTYSIENRYDASGNILSSSTIEFRFFPGRQLADVAKKP